MASSGGGGGRGDVPAERAAAAVNDLVEAREGATRLRVLLQEQSSGLTDLMDVMLNKLTSALSALNTGCAAGASAAGSGDGALKPTAESSARRTRKRSFSRRSQRSSGTRVTHTLVDGHIWRKYGQKQIQNSPHSRSYYRCTHKAERGCDAKRQVQACETDPSKFAITYYGDHTCTTAPVFIVGANDDRERNNLVSFARSLPQLAAAKEGGAAATQKLSSSWCTSDGVFNSSHADPFAQADELAAIVGSAGRTSSTVGPLPEPDYSALGDMAGGGQGGGTGSYPSSPSSLEFMVSSLGSIGDDDFFRCDQ